MVPLLETAPPPAAAAAAAAKYKMGEPQSVAARRGVPALSVDAPPPHSTQQGGASKEGEVVITPLGQVQKKGAPIATPSTADTASTHSSSVVSSGGAPSTSRPTPPDDRGGSPTSPGTPWHFLRLGHSAAPTPSAAVVPSGDAESRPFLPQMDHHAHVKAASTATMRAHCGKNDIIINTTSPTKEMVQTFSTKLVLEVFGGGGAVWGFSEVCTLRTAETLLFWRVNALLAAAIFAVRWLMQIRDYQLETSGSKPQISEGTTKRLAQIFSARMVLEVWGGGGAIWGISEVFTLRIEETQEFWRYNATVVAAIFFVRWCLQIREYVHEHGMFSGGAASVPAADEEECNTDVGNVELETPTTEKTSLTKNANSSSYGR